MPSSPLQQFSTTASKRAIRTPAASSAAISRIRADSVILDSMRSMGTWTAGYDDVVAVLARLDAANGLGAVVPREDAAALAAARARDARSPVGATPPTHQTVATVKDWIDVAGLPCEGESRERMHRMPERDLITS